MKLGWLIATVCLVCLFGFTMWLGIWGFAPLNSRPLAMKDALGPGPGFFPFWLAAIGISLGVLLLIEVYRGPAEKPETASLIPERAAAFRIIAIVVLLAAAAFALEPLGFRVTAFVFIALTSLALGLVSPVAITISSLLGSVGVFHVFYQWLKVPLPVGPYDYVLKPLGL